jgi:hypothetical protein
MRAEVAQWIARAWSKATRETIVNTLNGVGHKKPGGQRRQWRKQCVGSGRKKKWASHQPPINKMKRKIQIQRVLRQGGLSS